MALREVTDFRPVFVDTAADQKYRCELCKQTYIHPMQTPCGNRACKSCLDSLFSNTTGVVNCPFPHSDNEEDDAQAVCRFYRNNLSVDSVLERKLLQMQIFCKNKQYGCNAQINWNELEIHMTNCPFVPRECPNAQKGCSLLLALSDLHEHIKSCVFAETFCKNCGNPYQRRNEQQHLDNCKEVKTICDKCHRQYDSKGMLNIHVRIRCFDKEEPCFYCQGSPMNSADTKSHMETETISHIEWLAMECAEISRSTLTLNNTMGKTRQAHEQEWVDKVRVLERYLADFKLLLIDVTDQVEQKKLDRNLQKYWFLFDNRTMELHLQLLALENEVPEAIEKLAKLKDDVKGIGVAITTIPVKLTGDHHYGYIMGAGFKGSLTWKIDNYAEKKQQAVSLEMPFICSPAFYTSEGGYKLVCQAFLDGNVRYRGKYLSLGCIITIGRFDHVLKWPFPYNLSFTLCCPGNKNKDKTVLIDCHKAVFARAIKRPVTECNPAISIQDFISHQEVEASFIKNNVIYIKVKAIPAPVQ